MQWDKNKNENLKNNSIEGHIDVQYKEILNSYRLNFAIFVELVRLYVNYLHAVMISRAPLTTIRIAKW